MIAITRKVAGLITHISIISTVMSYPSLSERDRPRVVTAIGRLRLLVGILVTGLGLFMATSTTAYLELMDESLSDYGSQVELAYYSSFTGAIFVIQGVVGIIIAIGILGGKKWAWMANVVFSTVLVVIFISDIALGEVREIIGLIFNAFLLGCMFTTPVKLYFGRIGSTLTTAAPTSIPRA